MSGSTSSFKLLELTWKIANYRRQKFRNGTGKWIRSQDFPADCEGDLKFTLEFYPQGWVKSGDNEVTNGEKWASLFLKAEGSKRYDTSHRFEFSVLDADGQKFGIDHFHGKIPFQKWGFPKFIRVTDIENPANNLLPDDTLTICCRVEETKSKSEECKCQTEKPETPQARMGRDLATLLDDKYADFVFKVGNVNIPSHRAILAARSPVFAAMFQHDMQENKTNETEIKDVTPAAFRALLQFIYTGHCQVGVLAEQLLIAANKYDIQELKEICAKELRMQLTVDSAIRFLILSDLHRAAKLKESSISFINRNAVVVMKKPAWKDSMKTHPDLIAELYSNVFDAQDEAM